MEQNTIIVKTDNRNSQSATWPGVGLVTIDENGEFETSNIEGFNVLKQHFPEFYNKAEGKPVVEEAEKAPIEVIAKGEQDLSGEMDEEEIANQAKALAEVTGAGNVGLQTTEIKQDEVEEVIAPQTGSEVVVDKKAKEAEAKQIYITSLSTMRRQDLEEECKVNQFPGNEWRGKNKEDLIKYLTEKVTAA